MRFCTVAKAKVSLCKCADSPEPSLLAQNGIQSAVSNLLNTRPAFVDVEKAAVFFWVNILIPFLGVTKRGKRLRFGFFNQRLDFFRLGIFVSHWCQRNIRKKNEIHKQWA